MSVIDKATLCDLIPHAGEMCLLDEVAEWDEKHIVCRSRSHALANNPLRSEDGLHSVALLEYGAQAMAVHGGLLAQQQGEVIGNGYLASLRDISLADVKVDKIKEALLVEASCVMAQGGNMIYQFSVRAGKQELASGRATVVATE